MLPKSSIEIFYIPNIPYEKELLQGFHAIFLAKFPDFPWLFGTQVPCLSLTLARSELQGSHIFPKSKFKEFHGENLKEILLMICLS